MRKKFASSGNRTRAARVAGEHSTTEPTMLYELLAATYMGSCGGVVNATDSKSVSLWERRFESYRLRKSFFFTYLYARPYIRGQVYIRHCVCIVGSVVECSPATRAARVRFPDDAIIFSLSFHPPWPWLHFLQTLNVPGLVGSKTHSVCKKVFWRRGVSIPVPLTC